MARWIAGGMRGVRAQYIPDKATVREPTAEACSASARSRPGRRKASPPEMVSTSGWSSTLKLSTKRVNSSAGASSLASVELVAQCAQLSGQRRVSASEMPPAGTERKARRSVRCTGWFLRVGRVRPESGDVTACHGRDMAPMARPPLR